MIILSLKGEARSVVILPEVSINAGWRDIAFKIESSIKWPPQLAIKALHRTVDINVPFAKVVESSKWQPSPSICSELPIGSETVRKPPVDSSGNQDKANWEGVLLVPLESQWLKTQPIRHKKMVLHSLEESRWGTHI